MRGGRWWLAWHGAGGDAVGTSLLPHAVPDVGIGRGLGLRPDASLTAPLARSQGRPRQQATSINPGLGFTVLVLAALLVVLGVYALLGIGGVLLVDGWLLAAIACALLLVAEVREDLPPPAPKVRGINPPSSP
jgi:hypothetical protein